ncbi:PAX-interacting protein 1-like isoform X3 [Agrilus planipennis]|uniref:PAX-interacting protein 1 n=1 Tax=Agrilus planipennis TaxID=224129 RepID=A0A7F5R087_AGRPL|nr:PAX-interacting protein 1-like isoform X3 [Agrilus planipennis]
MELSGELENIKLEEQIFKDIKFYVTGEISDKVIALLKNGGAERMNYFTDYVTHLVCGNNPEENDLSDANDLYEIPAITPKWIFMSARLKKLVNQKPYLYNPNKLFSNCVFCFSKINEDRNSLWAVISYNGGKVQLNLDRKCTHLITVATDTAKYLKAMELGPDIIKVATPDWIIESVKNNGFAQIELYHPKLINWPKVTKYESTTAITGFEPPPTETEENLIETNLADSTTQALLDKLKQRMPWNQPQTSQSANDVVPPNVVAPTNTKIPQTPPASTVTPSSPTSNNTSQLNTQQQQQQQRFFSSTSQQLVQNSQHISQFSNASQIQQSLLTSNNQMPKSIVHHTPQGTIMNQPRPQLDVHQFKQSNQQVLQNVSQAQASQLIQNRLITQQQLQQRQHLLGQIGQINKLNQLTQLNQQNQFNQQLLQQQRAQGRPIGQPNVQISQSPQQPQSSQIVTINQQQINQNQQNLIQRMHLGQLSKNSVSMQQLNQQIQQHFANRQQNLNITQLSQNNQMQHLNIAQQVPTPTQQINQQPQQQQLHQNQGPPFTSVPQSPQSISQVVLSPQNQQNINIQQNKLIQSHFNQNLQGQINQQQILTSQQQQIVNLNQLRQKQFNQTQQFNDASSRTLTGFAQQQSNQQQQQQQQQPQQQNQPVQSPQQNQLIQNQQIQNSSQNQLIQIQQQNQQQQSQLIQNQQQQNQILQNQQSQQQTTQLITTQQQNTLIQNQQNQQPPNQLIQNQQPNQIIQSPQSSQLIQTQQVQFVQAQQFSQNQQQLIAHSPQSTQNLIPQSPQQPNQYSQSQQPQFIQQNQQVQIQQQQKFVQNQNQMQGVQQSNQFIQNQQQTNQQPQQPQPQIINQQINVNQQQLLINQQQNQTFQQQQTTTSGNQFNQQLLQQLPHSSIANQPQSQLVNTQNIVSQNPITQQQIVQQNQLNQQNIPPQLAQQQNMQNQQPNLVSQQNIPNQMVQQNIPAQQQPTIQINQPNLPGQQRPLGQNLWQQVGIRHAASVIHQQGAPRVQWPANHPQGGVIPQRQYIQLDAQTHQQLQQMAPEQRALFIAKLQRQRQLALQQKQQQLQLQQHQQQQQQRHVVIRVPPGLTPQQQMQWLQQQAKQQGVVLQQASIQQQPPPVATPNIPQGANVQSPNIQQPQQAPGLSPIQQQGAPQFTDHAQQLQIQRQQHFRLQQLQVQQQQREQQTPKPAPPIPQEPPVVPQANIARPLAHPQATETVPVSVVDANVAQQQLVVNAKTKTALANMLSIRLQSGSTNVGPVPETIAEPSAAGTLRLMTAQHNAALSSPGRPQDLLGLQQRRPVGAPTTELARPPAAPSVPPPTVGEPPKLQYSPRSNIPLQHRPGPFYGHNPNLKLPPDLFLLGCIFVVVEVERFLEESMPNWKQKIEKYGGEVENQYCSRVTHVLCETQRHGVVMQALRDFKRCVTLYWLSDILKRKQVLPPWTALHLPTMYLDTAPASKHLISLSGFVEPDRSKIKHMIKYIGATFTSYFSKHNTLLIAAKAEGEKFARAKKWGTPVVNIQWLTDVMLGHFSALNHIEHIKYQQFPTPPVFTFDPALVPTLMRTMFLFLFVNEIILIYVVLEAWKMPINISQESYERVKRCVSPVAMPKKTKKIKTETSNDENENPESFGNPNATHKILFSGCQNSDELRKVVINLNGAIAKTTTECTHLVMSTLQRTNKLLHCLCLGNVHIVPDSWLWDSRNVGKFLDEINYTFDTKEFNSMYKCDFGQTLQTKNRNKLLEGKFFFITPSVYPSKKFLAELVQSCGGVVEKIRRTASQIEATNISSPYSYIILTHENDLHIVYDVLRNKKNKVKIVCNVELLLSAILKQTFEIEPYTVKVL